MLSRPHQSCPETSGQVGPKYIKVLQNQRKCCIIMLSDLLREDFMCRERIVYSNNINDSDHLFRYMSLAQFISIIENQKLYLKKVKLWDDPWEAPDDQLPLMGKGGNPIFTESLLASSTVGQCWTCEKDSDAMWRIYSPDCQGVMIETVVKNFTFIENLRHASLAKVIYYNKSNYIEKRYEIANNHSYTFAGDMALKREAFKHENEVRLLVCLQDYHELGDIWEIPVVGFNIDPKQFITSITFDPRAEDWFVETMKKYCMSKQLNCPTEKSTLYTKDLFESTSIIRKYETVKK